MWYLYVDFLAYLIFGILWIFLPSQLLRINTVKKKFDSVELHMTRSFGIFLIYSSLLSLFAIMHFSKNSAMFAMSSRITLGLLLLAFMLTEQYSKNSDWDKKRHPLFGMVGLGITIVNAIVGVALISNMK